MWLIVPAEQAGVSTMAGHHVLRFAFASSLKVFWFLFMSYSLCGKSLCVSKMNGLACMVDSDAWLAHLNRKQLVTWRICLLATLLLFMLCYGPLYLGIH